MKTILVALGAAAALCPLGAGAGAGRAAPAGRVEVVVILKAPPLERRSLASTTGRRVEADQAAFERALHRAIPTAYVRWRYRKVLDGLAVVVPAGSAATLARLPGVEHVYASVRYHAKAVSGPSLTGLAQLWGSNLATAGAGMKIGIIDDGVDQAHPFLSPRGFTMPAGYPKGQTAYTTAKVIVARAFPPLSPRSKNASLPFDPESSFHATHVAGIAAGDFGTRATLSGQPTTISGVAPRAYIGNYKALTVATPGDGLDGNSPEIAAAIEAAVEDKMNVVNLSIGEPEVAPQRDLVVQALEGAARAGVVPVVAAGNDYEQFGRGSVDSPGNTPSAITVAASDQEGAVAPFSSSGPTPISLALKPDVTAPGAEVLSSVPPSQGTWAVYQGTSMATPHVSGAVAVLMQRHPGWTVEQLKSALEQTATDVYLDDQHQYVAPTTRTGGGLVNLPAADSPLLFAAPTSLSFGLVKPGTKLTRTVALADAGGGAGAWTATVTEQQAHDPAVSLAASSPTVPGTLTVSLTVGSGAAEADRTGFVVLSNGTATRRIPFWFRIETPRLGAPVATLARTGTYHGDTAHGSARVSAYRYPDAPAGVGLVTTLAGPEVVYRVVIAKPVANFGVAVVGGAKVTPRVVADGDENRLTGYAGLPVDLNPYASWFERDEPVAGAVLPAPGVYDVVFDEPSRAAAGPFTFRFWLDDTTPPALTLVNRTVPQHGTLLVRAVDTSAGVDPATVDARIDGGGATVHVRSGAVAIQVGGVAPGAHSLVVTASDYQETKNMEDVSKILPNTRTLTTRFVVSR